MNTTHSTPSHSPALFAWVKSALPYVVAGAVALLALLVAVPIAFIAGIEMRVDDQQAGVGADTVWTCSMHPEIRLPKPGKCPKCAMKLIPTTKTAASEHPRQYEMTEHAAALADIQTALVQRRYVVNTIRLVGKVDYDETRLVDITAWVPGRLDRLYVDYTGVPVLKGDHMVTIYSPDLVVAQKELILAQQNYDRFGQGRNDPALRSNIKSAEEKLRLMGLLKEQIEEIKRRQTPTDQVTIYAPAGGIVIQKNANEGAYVQTGTRIYTIADLTHVWVHFDAYESDVAWLRYGQQVEFESETYPGEIFKGRIAFIDPVLNEKTRTVRVRVNVPNQDQRLKPGMFVRARVKNSLARGGLVIDADLAGKWISPVHPEIVKDGPGQCDICGVDLIPAEQLGFVSASAGAEPALVIPATAPLITGRRAVVYVKVPGQGKPTFRGREVLLGYRAGDYYLVQHGLEEGEEVVTQGAFKIDSALQIQASPSMMSPAGGVAASGHEHHGAAQTTSTTRAPSDEQAGHAMAEIAVPAAFRLQLDGVYGAYLTASAALASDDLAAARGALQQLIQQVQHVDTQSLDADGRGRFKTVSDRLVFAADEALGGGDRAATRRGFQELSEAAMALIHNFGHALEQSVHQYHCPMAFDDQGASWLQLADTTANPYFGPQMLLCGDRKATFHPEAPLVVTPRFRQQLTPLYSAYFDLHQAMSTDDRPTAAQSVRAMQSTLADIDAALLERRTAQTWHVAHMALADSLSGDFSAMPVEEHREKFQAIALAMLGLVDNFGHQDDAPLYKAFCPMAFENKGAFWLQSSEAIVNPYFGGKMLTCGSVKRTFPTATAAPPREQP